MSSLKRKFRGDRICLDDNIGVKGMEGEVRYVANYKLFKKLW